MGEGSPLSLMIVAVKSKKQLKQQLQERKATYIYQTSMTIQYADLIGSEFHPKPMEVFPSLSVLNMKFVH